MVSLDTTMSSPHKAAAALGNVITGLAVDLMPADA